MDGKTIDVKKLIVIMICVDPMDLCNELTAKGLESPCDRI